MEATRCQKKHLLIYLPASEWHAWEWSKQVSNACTLASSINTKERNMKSYMEIYQKDATSEMYEQLTFQEQMFGSSEHLAKTSHSQDLEKDWGGDRSSLIGEVFRLIEEKAEDKPEWLVYENVKGMLSSNNGYDFLSILLAMDGLGYDTEWQTLNTKNFGLPQNRERVYTIGHLRKCGSKQILPITSSNGKDSNTKINVVGSTDLNKKIQQRKYIYGDDGLMGCLTATDYKEPKIVQIGRIESDKRENPSAYRVYDSQGLSPCLNTMQGGGREPHVLVKSATKCGYEVATVGDGINFAYPNSKLRRGRVGKGCAQTLDRSCNQGVFIQDGKEYVIRKLTPKECMRLQGVPDEYTDKLIQAGISDSQIYKAAGDGLSVPIAQEIGERIKKLL